MSFDIIEWQSRREKEETVEQQHTIAQRALAEALGTALLVLVGPGSVVATLVLAGKSVPAVTGADLLGISFAFGLIIAAVVYALGKVSGCHINPAITFALAVTKRFPWKEVPVYWASQVVGAVIGALGIWAVFAHTGIDLGMGQTAFNQHGTAWGQAIFAEGIGTFILMFAVLGIVDSRSPNMLAGLVIGGVVIAIIMVMGPITGASLNPARAFGPELVSAIGGGATHWNQLIPVYVLPGLTGSALAAVVYDFLANPRAVVRPIREAVTNVDSAPSATPAATH
jgi:glycerol uptake facilitator protein